MCPFSGMMTNSMRFMEGLILKSGDAVPLSVPTTTDARPTHCSLHAPREGYDKPPFVALAGEPGEGYRCQKRSVRARTNRGSPMDEPRVARPTVASRLLCASAAFVWLVSALGVLHPAYRESAAPYMKKLDLPNALMYATCVAEVLIGLRVLIGPASTWVTVLQVGLIG